MRNKEDGDNNNPSTRTNASDDENSDETVEYEVPAKMNHLNIRTQRGQKSLKNSPVRAEVV